MKKLLLVIASAFLVSQTASAYFVTLTARTENGTNYWDSLTLGTNQTVEVRAIYEPGFNYPSETPSSVFLVVTRTGKDYNIPSFLFLNGTNAMRLPIIIAGPATVKLQTYSTFPAFATLEVKTESFPPDKTLIIPGDSNGANVIMESSIDLVNWFSATPGAYTNRTNNLFFRLRAERLP